MLSSTACPDFSGKSRNAGKTLLHTLFFFLLVTQICFAQWYQQNSGTTQNLRAIHFVDENKGWAVGDSGLILHTSNAGINWTQQISGGDFSLCDLEFVDESYGWIVGNLGVYDNEYLLLKTTNGGIDWFSQMDGTVLTMNAVCFRNRNYGWVVGGVAHSDSLSSVILKTTNGGVNWVLQPSPAIWPIKDICFINNDVGYAVEGGGGVEWYSEGSTLKTTNGGDTWIKLTADTTVGWERVSFLDTQNGIIAGVHRSVFGNFPRVLYTIDGGINWMESNRGYEGYFTCFVFVESSHAWASGSPYALGRGAILFSSDKGANWSIQSDYSYSLNNVFFINSSIGWAVGDSGNVLHSTNGGVTFIDNEPTQPTDFLLSQNYPNPFNPSTLISYQLPVSSEVTLKVFDVLGNEVATLVDEYKPAGRYEVEFNAESIPSGVYFYQLRAGDYIQTNKMIIIK